MHDVGLTRQSAYTLMCLFCKVEGFGDEIDLLSVARGQIVVQQFLKGVVDQLVITFFVVQLIYIHSSRNLSCLFDSDFLACSDIGALDAIQFLQLGNSSAVALGNL